MQKKFQPSGSAESCVRLASDREPMHMFMCGLVYIPYCCASGTFIDYKKLGVRSLCITNILFH